MGNSTSSENNVKLLLAAVEQRHSEVAQSGAPGKQGRGRKGISRKSSLSVITTRKGKSARRRRSSLVSSATANVADTLTDKHLAEIVDAVPTMNPQDILGLLEQYGNRLSHEDAERLFAAVRSCEIQENEDDTEVDFDQDISMDRSVPRVVFTSQQEEVSV